MTVFNWDESDISWFLKRFKDEDMEISSRTVSRNHPRKKGQIRLFTQDFRNLMRLMVQSQQARVTKGHVGSRAYTIRMVSNEYSYIQELFSDEFFSHSLWNATTSGLSEVRNFYFSGIIGTVSDRYIQRLLSNWSKSINMFRYAFWIYTFAGADYDLLSNGRSIIEGEAIHVLKDNICLVFHYYICLYKLLKIAEPEIKILFQGAGAEDYNGLFIIMLKSDLTCDVLMSAQQEAKPLRESKITTYNKMKELFDCLKNGTPTQAQNALEYPDKYSAYSTVGSFWMHIPAISSRQEVLNAYDDCERAYLNLIRSSSRLLLVPSV